MAAGTDHLLNLIALGRRCPHLLQRKGPGAPAPSEANAAP